MKKSFTQFITIIPLALLLSLTFSCQQQGEKGITEEEAKALLDSALEIWNNGNMALIEDVFAPEIVARTSTFPEDIIGLEGIENWIKFARTAFPDMHMTFDEIIVKGDNIVGRFTVTGTNTGPLSMPFGDLPPTGKKVRFSGLGIDRVQNGKITEELVVYNVLDMMQQLGFTLTPPQPSETLSPVKATGSIIPPKLIKEVEPVYPEKAKEAGVEGWVMLEATTDIYGRVKNVKVLKSIPLLDQAAIDAVRKYVYTPMIIDGRPRGVIHTVTVKFHLK